MKTYNVCDDGILRQVADGDIGFWIKTIDYENDLTAKDARIAELEIAVLEFAGFFSSDDPRHWELHGLADNCTYGNAKEGESNE